MNVRQRLNEAYENVSFSADRTWTNSTDAYQNSNMELYLTERHIQRERLLRKRPRTVRECIPNSRLAHYSNYVYNESREMSYACSVSNVETTNLVMRFPTEPWEMPEVGELYKWFLKNQPEDYCSRIKGHYEYESPLLNVTGFEDKILKIQITEDRVKNIWKKDYKCEQQQSQIQKNQLHLSLFTSPMKNIYLFHNDTSHNYEWFRNISITRDFECIERLSKSLNHQTNTVSKFLTGVHDQPPSASESTSTEILYSEVLQGLTPSRKLSIKTDHGKSLTTDEATSTSQESFTNYTILSSQRSAQSETSKSDNFSQVPQTSNKFVSQKNIYFQMDNTQTYPRYKYQTQFPRTPILPSSYLPQTYFYSPVQTTQRWVPPNFTNYYPPQIFNPSWYTQNPIMSSRIFGPSPASTNSDNFNGQFFDCARIEDTSHFKEETVGVETLIEDHQVSASISEELEIQALEQYSNSNENLYQELERQAAEQYTNSPD